MNPIDKSNGLVILLVAMSKKFIWFLFLMIALYLSVIEANAIQKRIRLILATATTGGTYYPVGVAIATLTTNELKKTDNIYMTAITSAGSGENIQLLKNKEADLAIIQSLVGAMVWQGKDKYEGKPERFIRSISCLWDNADHFVILNKFAKTGDMSDLNNVRGKNFSMGKRGSGTEISGRVIMKALGFDPDKDFKLKYLGYVPSANALQNGRIAGMNIPAGPPVSAITQAFAAIGAKSLRILGFTEKQVEAVNAVYSVWRPYTIKAGTYPGLEEDVHTISQSNLLVVHQDIDDEVVYKIVKNIFENLSYLQKIHQATKEMSLEKALAGMTVPLHPGAVKYYREKRIKIPSRILSK